MFKKSKVSSYKDFYKNKSLKIYEIQDFQCPLFISYGKYNFHYTLIKTSISYYLTSIFKSTY